MVLSNDARALGFTSGLEGYPSLFSMYAATSFLTPSLPLAHHAQLSEGHTYMASSKLSSQDTAAFRCFDMTLSVGSLCHLRLASILRICKAVQ